jgi:hypothetical protein
MIACEGSGAVQKEGFGEERPSHVGVLTPQESHICCSDCPKRHFLDSLWLRQAALGSPRGVCWKKKMKQFRRRQ